MPLFATERTATNLIVLDGDYALLGITSKRAEGGANTHAYTFLFVRATLR